MTEYLVPYESAESEFEEKRSRFISHVFLAETETEARARIDEMKKKYYDARHNCWCYVLHEGGVVRYGDDGEPQGTAGQPMLNVLQREGVENVAREKCAQEDVALTITAQEKLERISSSLDGQEFKYRGRGPYHLRLLGEYQLLNALTVIDVCSALRSRGWDKLTDAAIDQGLSTAQWPGRLELLRRSPDFIVDGAHNPQCVDALMDSLAALYGDKKLIFLTGVLRDKDWQQMLRRALPLAKAFVVITPPSARALDENELAAWLNAQGVQAIPAKDTDDGVCRALELAGEDDAICSWGSLYFTGEVRHALSAQ